MHTLSKKSQYALKALLALAGRHDSAPVQIAGLAKRERIPQKFLELILLELRHAGILQSRKGKGGGYALARPAEAISVAEIIRALDGPLTQIPESDSMCGVRALMTDVRAATASILEKESLAGLLRRTESLQQSRKNVLVYAI